MRISIFAKLALTFLVIVAGVVWFLAARAGRELEKSFDALVIEREERMASGIGAEVDLLLNGLESQLSGMAVNQDLKGLLVERGTALSTVGDRALIEYVNDLRAIAGLDRLWVVSVHGILLAESHESAEEPRQYAFGDDFLDPPGTYTDSLMQALSGDTVKKVGVEQIAADSLFVAEVFIPITTYDGLLGRYQVEAVLWGAQQLDTDFMTRASRLAGAELVVESSHFSPLTSLPQGMIDPNLLARLGEGQREISLGNEIYVPATLPFPGSVTESPDSSVTLHLLVPKSDLLERNRRLMEAIFIEAAIGAVVALLFAFLISKSITLPIERLKTAVMGLAAGDLSRRAEVHSLDEVEDLVHAFNMMADDLEHNTRRLVEAEKLTAWREVARRLAHEIKNPLSPIKLSVQNLVRTYGRGDSKNYENTLNETSETILEEVERLRTLADEFSNFARMPKPVLVPTDVSEIVRSAASLYDKAVSGAKIDMKIGSNLPEIMADRDALSRVLKNLLKNAQEAMEGRTGSIEISAEPVRIGGMPWVRISVLDHGVGMDEEALKHSFNPYFTTKRGGSGLGLAIVQSIVSEHGGRIRIASELGKGTLVVLELPGSEG
jgi:signal transduction histidine kinase